MTNMQLIIPPWEESGSQDGSKSLTKDNEEDLDRREATHSTEKEEENSNHSGSNILPPELKEKFEAIRALGRQLGRASNYETEKHYESDDASASNGVPDGNTSKEDLKRKERAIATDAALAIDSEISKWRNGIAELEAVLAAMDEEDEAEQGGSHVEGGRELPNPPRVIRFPALPPLVPPEEDEDVRSRERTSSTESGLTLMTDATAAASRDQDMKE